MPTPMREFPNIGWKKAQKYGTGAYHVVLTVSPAARPNRMKAIKIDILLPGGTEGQTTRLHMGGTTTLREERAVEDEQYPFHWDGQINPPSFTEGITLHNGNTFWVSDGMVWNEEEMSGRKELSPEDRR